MTRLQVSNYLLVESYFDPEYKGFVVDWEATVSEMSYFLRDEFITSSRSTRMSLFTVT